MKPLNLSIFSSKYSPIKPFLVYLAAFYLLSIMIDGLFTHLIINSNNTTNYYKLNRLVKQNHSLEIPLFGSSTVLRGLLPHKLGSEFYNYGITATNYQKLEPLLLTELDKNKTTPIIIEMPPPFFNEREQPNTRIEDIIPFSEQNHFRDFMEQYKLWKPWYGAKGLRYYGFYSTYLSSFINQSLPSEVLFSKGSRSVKKRNTDNFDQLVKGRWKNPVGFEASPSMISKFEKLVENTDREIIIIISPFHKSVYDSGFDITEYETLFRRLEANHPNLKGLIFDGEDYSDDLFLDTSHLNYWGAIRFTNELKQELINYGVIESVN